jgi:hypothetical protein
VNPALRAHVTRVGFDLQLAKSHIAALVYLNEIGARRWDFCAVNSPRLRVSGYGRAFSMFSTGAIGLQIRGLVTHDSAVSYDERVSFDGDGIQHLYSKAWTITRAGRLVIDLLKEAGLYDEFAAELTYTDRPVGKGHRGV